MDCNSRLEGDERCPCCTRSVMPAAEQSGMVSVHLLSVRVACALIIGGLVDDALDEGAQAVDLTAAM